MDNIRGHVRLVKRLRDNVFKVEDDIDCLAKMCSFLPLISDVATGQFLTKSKKYIAELQRLKECVDKLKSQAESGQASHLMSGEYLYVDDYIDIINKVSSLKRKLAQLEKRHFVIKILELGASFAAPTEGGWSSPPKTGSKIMIK